MSVNFIRQCLGPREDLTEAESRGRSAARAMLMLFASGTVTGGLYHAERCTLGLEAGFIRTF
jgi:hypothetical protein